MKTGIVWFRDDLRIHDNPALHAAAADCDIVLPIFIMDDTLLSGRAASHNRNKFLYECLIDLRNSLASIGGTLYVYRGNVLDIMQKLLESTENPALYFSRSYTPFSRVRDDSIRELCERRQVACKTYPGRLAIDSLGGVVAKSGAPYKVFTPFWKTWTQVQRRPIVPAPRKLCLADASGHHFPEPHDMYDEARVSARILQGGEGHGRKRLTFFLHKKVAHYAQEQNTMAADSTSRLSPYLHFGCLSVREIEVMLPNNNGAHAWHRQLAWRDFYSYILFHFPHTMDQEFQEQFRDLKWQYNKDHFESWKAGKTGYPVVDAAMRQLQEEGWMHNRARLIVGSFLTKDLGIDWRLGEAYFRSMLVDGDVASNVGNWQWIGSVGVDPAPLFRRLYNPVAQQKTYDPDGTYVRTYVHELRDVPDEFLHEPWNMTKKEQLTYGCVIGVDYPAPIIDHAAARQQAIERYKRAQK